MDVEISPPSQKARISSVSDDRYRLYVDYPNGTTGWIESSTEPFDFEPHTVLLIRPEDGGGLALEQAPEEVWPEEPWVGVIRLRDEHNTVVDIDGRIKLIDTNEIDYSPENTVIGRDSLGVVSVLDEKPLRRIDLAGAGDGQDLGHFRFESDAEGLKYADFGGFSQVVARAKELIELPLRRREALRRIGARAIKGVMFTGPPGTGKTMLAQIIANEAGANFYTINGPQVFSKWFGESEQTLRRIFDDARDNALAIIFFDEIDSVATQRAESHEASRRVVAQLLTLMDGFEPSSNVVVIAATNRPGDIDVALRRPGRFDWEIEFGLPDLADRESILRRASSRLTTTGVLPHERVAAQTEGWSSAEIAAIWSEAALLAVADDRESIIAEDYLGGHLRVSGQRQRVRRQDREQEEVS